MRRAEERLAKAARAARVARLARAAGLGATAGLTALGCSLGLDASLIGQAQGDASVDGAGGDAPTATDGAMTGSDAEGGPVKTGDAASAGDAGIVLDAGQCATDADCKTAAAAGGACVTSATCDPTFHVCLLDVCGNGASCQAEVCQPSSMTCTLPATYAFAPAAFTVTYGGVIPQGPQVAITAAWPFVFVVTNNGVAAYNVADPTNGSPPYVPVHGLPFIPSSSVAVGRRIYFTSDPQGAGPVFRQAIAWVDVPQNPFLTSLTATSAWVQTPDTSLVGIASNGVDGLFLVYNDMPHEPSVNLSPPITDSTTLAPFANPGLANGEGIVASTGTRLLATRYDGAQVPYFQFINKAGTSAVAVGTELAFNAWGKLDNQAGFTTGGDGSVVWETAVLDELDTGSTDGIAHARLGWLIDSATAGNPDSTAYVDLVSYAPLAGGQVVSAPAWVDANTALGFAVPSSNSTDSTLVQIVRKGSPRPSIVPGANATKTLGVAPGALGVATSNGYAYVLQRTDPQKNQSCTVQILAPSCGGTD